MPQNQGVGSKKGADIYFCDSAHSIIETRGARHGVHLILRSFRAAMRFMIKKSGDVNAAVFIAFLKRLVAGAKCTIFLIALMDGFSGGCSFFSHYPLLLDAAEARIIVAAPSKFGARLIVR